MALTDAQRTAIEEVLGVILAATATKPKRRLAEPFEELPDRDAWSEYYEIIKEPRCLDSIKFKLTRKDKNGYSDVFEARADLDLVFSNALYYNEGTSQIAKDATHLKAVLDEEWTKRSSVLPAAPARTELSKNKFSSSKLKNTAISDASAVKQAPSMPLVPSLPVMVPSASASSQALQDGEADDQSDNDGEGGTQGYQGPQTAVSRDADSDSIVFRLECSLPKWPGYGEQGWFEEQNMNKCIELVHAIRTHKDIITHSRFAAVVDAIPEDVVAKNMSFSFPLSLKSIESKAREHLYPNSKEFDKDMTRMFEKARRWYEIGTDEYGDVCLLQRLYQALTSVNPPSGPPYASQTNFSAIRAGPGNAKPVHGQAASDAELVTGVTTFRISNKDRHFVDELHYKGWSLRLADWLHLANPDDPNRPIVGQIFKCWVSDEPSRLGRPGITACWYYRPEQTYHPPNREFWENEVFKTGHFADHQLEDIIEKIALQFTARHLRGRPRAPFWWPGWPLYVCDSRYNDRDRVFVRIKNWASCVPEEVRKKPDWMPIYEFERSVPPKRLASPFLPSSNCKGRRGGRLPGGVGEYAEVKETERTETSSSARKRTRKSTGVPATPGPGGVRTAGVSVSAMAQQQQQLQQQQLQTPAPTQTVNYPQQQQQTIPPLVMSSIASQSLASYQALQKQLLAANSQTNPQESKSAFPTERTIVAAAGGPVALANSFTQKLPPETARHFDRDPATNQVLWFSGPPIDVAKPSKPRHSLTYLHHLATKKKNRVAETEGLAEDVDSESRKKAKVEVQRPASEVLNEIYESVFGPTT